LNIIRWELIKLLQEKGNDDDIIEMGYFYDEYEMTREPITQVVYDEGLIIFASDDYVHL